MSKKRNYAEEIGTSRFAWRILRQIVILDKPYTTKIAEELDSEPQSVSNYIKGLRERGLIKKKEKRGRVQIYEPSFDGIYNYWLEIEHCESEEDFLNTIEPIIPEETLKEISLNLRTFILSIFIQKIVEEDERTMLDGDESLNVLSGQLGSYVSKNWDSCPEWLKWLSIGIEYRVFRSGSDSELIEKSKDFAEKLADDEEILEEILTED